MNEKQQEVAQAKAEKVLEFAKSINVSISARIQTTPEGGIVPFLMFKDIEDYKNKDL